MEHRILYRPTYSLAEIRLEEGEAIQAEAGAMVYMSENVKLETKMKGGVLGALKRTLLGGESFFVNTYRAHGGDGTIGLAPPYQGDITHHTLSGELFVQSGSFLACSPEVDIDIKWGGAKTFFGREGLFLLKMKGEGSVFLSSFGAIHEVELRGESFVVDTGHIVAFTPGVDFSLRRAGGMKEALLSGEGLVAEFSGHGKLYLQTRSVGSFMNWLLPLLPSREG
jgi:uncharacterized protein (TIGR00266 family)